jgi:hypothetical protein
MSIETIELESGVLPVWPEGQTIGGRGSDRTLMRTVFPDTEAYHPRLIERIFEMEKDPAFTKTYMKAIGGTKINHIDRWGIPEADLIHARAIALFKRTTQIETAAVDLSWANVYRDGAYAMAHSHPRSTASVVYCVDPGEEDPEDEMSGRFCIIDPRVAACCQIEKHCMTNPLMPNMTAGSMIVFPGQLLHAVNPYTGKRPRITMSWNLNSEALPGSPFDVLPEDGS